MKSAERMVHMRSSKCTMAAITAFIMTAAMAASAAPAFAYEGAEALINSYGNPVAQDIAEYCLDNGMSLEETKELVDGYASRHPVTVARSATGDTVSSNYYNPNQGADSPHYVALILTNTTEQVGGNYAMYFNTAYAEYNGTSSLCRGYATTSNAHIHVTTGIGISMNILAPAGVTTASKSAFAKLGIDHTENSTEATIYSAISSSDITQDPDIAYDTYALGDVEHDGDVDSIDTDRLLEYIVESRDDLSFIYNDSNSGVGVHSAITNWLAADANGDNRISLADVTEIQDMEWFVNRSN